MENSGEWRSPLPARRSGRKSPGEAIKALQSQTNIGTLNWQDQLHRHSSPSPTCVALV